MPQNSPLSPAPLKHSKFFAEQSLDAFLSRLIFRRLEQSDQEPDFERLDVTDGLHHAIAKSPHRLSH